MQKVMRELQRRGVDLKSVSALEVFGRDGHWHTQCYAQLVQSLEVWEIQDKYREVLRKNLPMATVKITDSFQEIKRTSTKYDLIVVDNSLGTFRDDPVPGGVNTTYCEHFDLFPFIFWALKDSAIIILNVIPKINGAAQKKYPLLFDAAQLNRRRDFYRTDHPEDISLSEIMDCYRRVIEGASLKLEWAFFQKRSRRGIVYYLVLKIIRANAATN